MQLAIIQQGVVLLVAMLVLDGGQLLRQMAGGALIFWFEMLLCAVLSRRKDWNEVHGYYFATWSYVGIATVIFIRMALRH